MSLSTISYLWREPKATASFAAGVSLHSHTNQSREHLNFLAELSTSRPLLDALLRLMERRATRRSGIQPDFDQAYWTPPLTPRLALEVEQRQIEEALALPALVSLTDHDSITAPLLLRSIPNGPAVPISVEWTVPFFETALHVGVHNLPAAAAHAWMARSMPFAAGRIGPGRTETAESFAWLREALAELHAMPEVLVVLNHPMWDLHRVGAARHAVLLNEFLARFGQFLHALELNGLRGWGENRDTRHLAAQWNQLVISGGDRHGLEPNANVNLTHASTFPEFVEEVRRDRQSHVLFMPQYAEPLKHRFLLSTMDAIRYQPQLPEGSQRWDQRVFHPDADGISLPLSELWPTGRPPAFARALLAGVRVLGRRPVSEPLRFAWERDAVQRAAMRSTLAHLD